MLALAGIACTLTVKLRRFTASIFSLLCSVDWFLLTEETIITLASIACVFTVQLLILIACIFSLLCSVDWLQLAEEIINKLIEVSEPWLFTLEKGFDLDRLMGLIQSCLCGGCEDDTDREKVAFTRYNYNSLAVTEAPSTTNIANTSPSQVCVETPSVADPPIRKELTVTEPPCLTNTANSTSGQACVETVNTPIDRKGQRVNKPHCPTPTASTSPSQDCVEIVNTPSATNLPIRKKQRVRKTPCPTSTASTPHSQVCVEAVNAPTVANIPVKKKRKVKKTPRPTPTASPPPNQVCVETANSPTVANISARKKCTITESPRPTTTANTSSSQVCVEMRNATSVSNLPVECPVHLHENSMQQFGSARSPWFFIPPTLQFDLAYHYRDQVGTSGKYFSQFGIADLFQELQQGSSEFLFVQHKFMQSAQYHFQVNRIDRVNNMFLRLFYMMKKEEYEILNGKNNIMEELLFHGSSYENIIRICIHNFDWRLHGKRGLFGKGVNFSNSSKYASNYCDKYNPRVMILAKVLKSHSCKGTNQMDIPPFFDEYSNVRYDTSQKPDGAVIVKYKDDEFYPEFIIYFTGSTFGSNK